MRHVADPRPHLTWLQAADPRGDETGFDADGFEAAVWILHAMYANPELAGTGTHDEAHRAALAAGTIEPVVFHGVDVEVGTVTGTPIGYYGRPGPGWERITWRQYLGPRLPAADHDRPPSRHWFPDAGSFPAMTEPPGEGTMDHDSFLGLIAALGTTTAAGMDAECCAMYALLASVDLDGPELWQGPLTDVPGLLEAFDGRYPTTPSNIWPPDRSWLVYTDHDLWATKVSGPRGLINMLHDVDHLETVPCPPR